jgi:hypothetical protein
VSTISFQAKLSLVLLLGLIVVLVDLYRRGRASSKWKEYLYLLLGGLLGALFAAGNDVFVTSRISPDYFTLGKGIAPGAGFEGRVLFLGLQAGLGPGMIIGAVLLFTRSRRPDRLLPWSRCIGALLLPMLSAVVAGVIFPWFLAPWDPLRFGQALGTRLGSVALKQFMLVWWIHLSLYLGAVVGTLWAIGVVRRFRREGKGGPHAEPAQAS